MKPVNVSAKSAENYYYEKDPIFNEKGEGNNIEFQGLTAEALGLVNGQNLNKEEFKNLLQGKSKDGTELTSDGGNDKKRACIDIPFGAPKSVSHVALVLGDQRVIKAHNEAVTEAIKFMEKNYAKTREYVKDENGKIAKDESGQKIRQTVNTGNLAVAKVLHSTSRPVEGQAPDPFLHTHALIMNMTYHDNKFKALDNQDFFKNQKLSQEIYRASLAKSLENLGYGIDKKNGGSFEISGYDQKTLDNFSKRHFEVQDKKQELIDKGFSGSDGLLSELAQHTSKADKVKISSNELRADWEKQHSMNGIQSIEDIKEKVSSKEQYIEKWNHSVQETLKIAIDNLTRNNSVCSKASLITESLILSRGKYDYKDFEKDIENIKKIGQTSDRDIKRLGENFFTTKEIYDKEKNIMSTIDKDRRVEPLMSKESSDICLQEFIKYKAKELGVETVTLTKGQREMAEAILTSDRSIIVIDGHAGSGKSFGLEAVRFALDYADKNGLALDQTRLKASIIALSTTGKAASNLEQATKIDSKTIAKYTIEQERDLNAHSLKELNSFNGIKETHISMKASGLSKDIFDKNKFQIGGGALGITKDSHVYKNRSNFLGVYKEHKVETITSGDFKGSVQDKTLKISGFTIESNTKNSFNDGKVVERKVVSTLDKGISGTISSFFFKGQNTKENSFDKKTNNSQDITTRDKTYLSLLQTRTQESEKSFKYGENKEKEGTVKEKIVRLGTLGVTEYKTTRESNFDNDLKRLERIKEINTLGFKQVSGTRIDKDKNDKIVSSTVFKEKQSPFNKEEKNGVIVTMKDGKISSTNYTRDKNDNVLSSETKFLGTYEKGEEEKFVSMLDKNIHSLNDINRQETRIIVDEAGMTSSRDLEKLIMDNEKNKGVLILTGDDKQIKSVGEGNSYSKILEAGNVQIVKMEESLRQKTEDAKAVVKLFEERKPFEALDLLDKQGNLKELKGEDSIDFMSKFVLQSEKDSIAIVNTNSEVDSVNSKVRELKYGDSTSGEKFNTLDHKNFSELDKRTADKYTDKNVIRMFDSKTKQSKEFEVVSKDIMKNTLEVKDDKGKISTLDLKTDKKLDFTVLEKKETHLNAGDRIVFLKNEKNSGLFNGDTAVVSKIEGSKLHLVNENKKEIVIDTEKYKDFKHGYAITTNKSQGSTYKRDVSSVQTKEGNISNFNSIYVQSTRHKEEHTIVTDNKDLLKEIAKADQFKNSTLDFPKNENNENYLTRNSEKGSIKIDPSSIDIRNEISKVRGNSQEKRSGVVDKNQVDRDMNKFKKQRDSSVLDSKDHREGQRGFFDAQAVSRNGVSTGSLESFADYSVSKNYMSREDADKFVSNSLQNAENLEKVGIIQSDGKGNYNFVDEKAKEILSQNLGKDYKDIGDKNLEAYGSKIDKTEIAPSFEKGVESQKDTLNKVETDKNVSSQKQQEPIKTDNEKTDKVENKDNLVK